jgi:hypothetical protein
MKKLGTGLMIAAGAIAIGAPAFALIGGSSLGLGIVAGAVGAAVGGSIGGVLANDEAREKLLTFGGGAVGASGGVALVMAAATNPVGWALLGGLVAGAVVGAIGGKVANAVINTVLEAPGKLWDKFVKPLFGGKDNSPELAQAPEGRQPNVAEHGRVNERGHEQEFSRGGNEHDGGFVSPSKTPGMSNSRINGGRNNSDAIDVDVRTR